MRGMNPCINGDLGRIRILEDIAYRLDGVAEVLRGFSGNPECGQAAAMDMLAKEVEVITNGLREYMQEH